MSPDPSGDLAMPLAGFPWPRSPVGPLPLAASICGSRPDLRSGCQHSPSLYPPPPGRPHRESRVRGDRGQRRPPRPLFWAAIRSLGPARPLHQRRPTPTAALIPVGVLAQIPQVHLLLTSLTASPPTAGPSHALPPLQSRQEKARRGAGRASGPLRAPSAGETVSF